MTENKKPGTSRSNPEQNPLYPRFASDRADALIDQLDSAQVMLLYNELRTMTFSEWSRWLEDSWVKIGKYDRLSASERQNLLDNMHDNEPLLLQHACIFVELWRVRLQTQFHPVHGNYRLEQDQAEQRALMLAAIVSYYEPHPKDYWPFDHEDIPNRIPFRGDS